MMSPCWAGNVMQDFQINIICVSTTNLRWVWISVTSASRSGVRKRSSDYFLYKNFYTLLEHLKHFILQASLTHSIISSMPNYFLLMKTSLTANRTTQSHYATNNYTREKSLFWLSTAEISAPLFLRNQLKNQNQKPWTVWAVSWRGGCSSGSTNWKVGGSIPICASLHAKSILGQDNNPAFQCIHWRMNVSQKALT